MKFKEWSYIWLDTYQKRNVKLKTYYHYKQIIEKCFIPYFNEELNKITSEQITQFINELKEGSNAQNHKKLASNTINLYIAILKGIFNSAYELDLISTNPIAKIKRCKIGEKRIESFTLEQQRKIEKYCMENETDRMLGIILCLYTGLRIGELLALKWDDIDFEDQYLFVNKTVSRIGTKVILTEPKTYSSIRHIPLSKKILNQLKQLKKKQKSEFVICNKQGEMMPIRSYQYIFESLLNKLNIRKLNFHALRHTFATRAIEQGIDIKTLSELLGHKNATITLNRYVHSMLDTKKKAMNKLAKLLNHHCA